MKAIAVVLAISLASAGELLATQSGAASATPVTSTMAAKTAVSEPTVRLDVTNFCCPDYIASLRKSIAENWQAPDIAGTTVVRFVIERNGQISKAEIEQPSGVAAADERALRAVRLAKTARLPSAFNQQTLTVHLTFASQPRPAPSADTSSGTAEASAGSKPATTLGDALRNLQRFVSQGDVRTTDVKGATEPGTSVEFDTQGVEFGPWIRRFIAQVKRNWFIPSAASTQKGRTVVTFSVSKAGEIRDVKVVQPSGVDQFDRSAFNAILNANPLDPLPPAYPKDEAHFTVSFYYNERPPERP